MRWRWIAASLLIGVMGCGGDESFVCQDDAECSSAQGDGRCEATGYCSFEDPLCISGRRYGDLARDDLAGLCVPPTDGDTDGPSTASDGSGGDDDSICGDGLRTGNEVCDAADLGGQTCAGLGFVGGALQCTTDCVFDTSFCSTCGNQQLDPGEDCDGSETGVAQTCADLGLGEETEFLSCTAQCRYAFGECSSCGDGMVVEPEGCDPAAETNASCVGLGFDGGDVACTKECVLDTSGCAVCGNGRAESSEACDGADLAGLTCESEGFSGGALQCAPDCTLDTSGCASCGDGAANGNEDCDQLDLRGQTCEGLGFTSGSLGCSRTCDYDVSACIGAGCGNGVVELDEACDGPPSQTCASEGFDGGSISCSGNCTLDTDGCYACGDGSLDPGEDCDGNNLGGQSCADLLPGTTGSPTCTASCTFNTSGCATPPQCGNGVVDPGEDCDGDNFNGLTCLDYEPETMFGELECNPDCSINIDNCIFD